MPLMTLPPRRPRLTPLALCLTVALAAAPAAGQSGRSSGETNEHLQAYAYTLRHKPAAEALVLIRPLLSKRGTVELQPEGNTLVVRDTLAALGRIVPTLRSYDRAPQGLRVEVMIVRAFTRPVATARGERSLPDWLEERLQALLRWDHYRVLAEAGLDTREGQGLTHELGGLYGISFRMGTLLQDERVKLHDFKIWRSGPEEDQALLEATLNLWLDKPKVLGLASSESSDHALMVVLTCRRRVAGEVQVSPPFLEDGPQEESGEPPPRRQR